MVGSAESALIAPLDPVRHDILTILRAGIDAASAGGALARALADDDLRRELRAAPVHVIAAGKAAAHMSAAWLSIGDIATRRVLVVSTHQDIALPSAIEWHEAGHPLPDARSVAAAVRALDLASSVPSGETLVLLLSGGASALLARPIPGISLEEKQQVVDLMLRGGADIQALNTVRKHISSIKGGRLAAACRGAAITLAISDVVGDDLAVIGSGPCVADPSTWSDAMGALDRFVAAGEQPARVRHVIRRGLAGELDDTPKPGHPSIARASARVIAGAADAMRGASEAAERLGYRVIALNERVTGESREAALAWLRKAQAVAAGGPACLLSSGETTVCVTGRGRGGRNQEFALSAARELAGGRVKAVASAGTDGIDGPTDAAGGIADTTTAGRAAELGISLESHLNDNNSYAFFAALGDLIVTGPTGTNVGDLQIAIL